MAVLLTLGVATMLSAGAIGMVGAHLTLWEASVHLELDASRRWDTISGVHPNFAAEVDRQVSQSMP